MQTIKKARHSLPLAAIALALSGIALGLICLYLSTGNYKMPLFSFYLDRPVIVVLNVLPFFLFVFLIFFLTNRIWAAFALNSVLCFLFSLPNYWKLLARDSPVVATDLIIVSEAMNIGGQYITMPPKIICALLGSVVLTVLFALFFRVRIKSWKSRIVMVLIMVLICCMLFCTVYTDESLYDAQESWPLLNPWFTTTKLISRGGIYPFFYSIPEAFLEPPSGYDKEEIHSVLDGYAYDDIPEGKQVSVIFVMLEAFADLSGYTDKITVADPYAIYHDLQAESYCGKLITNIFAGGTYDSEQSVVTGFPYIKTFSRPSWSYVRYFTEQGYTINGAHAGHRGFYNRGNVNAFLGFPEYRFIDNYYSMLPASTLPSWNDLDKETRYLLEHLYGYEIPRDFQFFPDITAYCKRQIDSGNPVFSFNVTYQNHGPYPADEVLYAQEYVSPDDIPEADYHIANHYFAGVYDTTLRMQEMLDSFRDYEEPVILVFFGDHKPWFGEQNSTYHALGIDIASNSDDSLLNYYSTEYLIWANDSAKNTLDNSFVGTGPTVSPCFLMNVLFEQCGWDGPEYMKLTNEVRQTIPVVHNTRRYLIDDKFVTADHLDENQASILNALNYAEHYYMFDYSVR